MVKVEGGLTFPVEINRRDADLTGLDQALEVIEAELSSLGVGLVVGDALRERMNDIAGLRLGAMLEGALIQYKERGLREADLDFLVADLVLSLSLDEIYNSDLLDDANFWLYFRIAFQLRHELAAIPVDWDRLQQIVSSAGDMEDASVYREFVSEVKVQYGDKAFNDLRQRVVGLLSSAIAENGDAIVTHWVYPRKTREFEDGCKVHLGKREVLIEGAVRGGDQSIRVSLDPSKEFIRYAIAQDVSVVLPESLIHLAKESAAGIRKVLVHRLNELIIGEGWREWDFESSHTVVWVRQLIDGGFLSEPGETYAHMPAIRDLFDTYLRSGIWILSNEFMEAAKSFHEFTRVFLLSPDKLTYMAALLDYFDSIQIDVPKRDYQQIKVKAAAGFPASLFSKYDPSGTVSVQKNEAEESSGQESLTERKSSVSIDIFGIPEYMRPASVSGVARILEAAGYEELRHRIYTNMDSPAQEFDYVIYGTTDCANPVEAAMVASVPGKEQVYIADQTAHTVGSYINRILLPSLVSQGLVTGDEINTLRKNLGRSFGKADDASLQDIIDASGRHTGVLKYFTKICDQVGVNLSQAKFKQLYMRLNQVQAEILGIEYQEGVELLRSQGLTVGEFRQMLANTVAVSEQVYQSVVDYIDAHPNRELFEDDSIQNFLDAIFGTAGSWTQANRVVFKSPSGGSLNVEDFDEDELLADLLEGKRVALGGNAWLTIMSCLSKKLGKKVTVAHKETKLGFNYLIQLVANPDLIYRMLPVVRVVPDSGNGGSTGDGFDIGGYLNDPSLYTQVLHDLQANELSHGDVRIQEVIGGRRDLVLRVSDVELPVNGRIRNYRMLYRHTKASEGGAHRDHRYIFIDKNLEV